METHPLLIQPLLVTPWMSPWRSTLAWWPTVSLDLRPVKLVKDPIYYLGILESLAPNRYFESKGCKRLLWNVENIKEVEFIKDPVEYVFSSGMPLVSSDGPPTKIPVLMAGK
ncbi:hypothetical protein NPIL_207041 [Nephila pilipes]|uniref:Uncharacterized protein n=1 Tax=Nephila pilipes TaxID=299642 RepID=A0A8X6N1N5_NEPPI|nr:hypothetical protein NPIL_207041 [Nephila pilipes]